MVKDHPGMIAGTIYNHIIMNKTKIRFITLTALLLALTLVIQLAGLPQPVTGPLVNAMLVLTTMIVGIGGGVAVGALTPWVAYMRGILPPLLASLIPFIMLANIVLVVVFGTLGKRNYWLGIGVAALCKYGVFVLAINFLFTFPPRLAQAFQLPQLITALVGGVIALAVYRMLPLQYKRKTEEL